MRQVSEDPRDINITGCVSPFYLNNQPVIVEVEGVQFVVIFSSVEKLEAQLPTIKPHGPTKIVEITNAPEFLASVLPRYRVMLDLHPVGDRTRWTEVLLPGAPSEGIQT